MTARQIKRLLQENRELGLRPGALKHIADDLGISRSMTTTALKTPRRYPALRRRIEAVLLEGAPARARESGASADALTLMERLERLTRRRIAKRYIG